MKNARVKSVFVCSVLAISVILLGCDKEGPTEPSAPSVENIAGEYGLDFSYHFSGSAFSADITGSSSPHEITQDGGNFTVGSCSGTIDENNNVRFSGSLISTGGSQDFSGTYNKEAQRISGTFTGTTRERGPYGGYYSGTVSNASFSLTKGKSVEPPLPGPAGGSMSFTCTQGEFSASGFFDPGATAGSGVGWLDAKTIVAYDVISPTNGSVAILTFENTPTTGDHSFAEQGAGFIWALNVSLEDSADVGANMCILFSGSVNVSSLTGQYIEGTFSGAGSYLIDPAQLVTVTDGVFSILSGALSKGRPGLPAKIDSIARRLIERGYQ